MPQQPGQIDFTQPPRAIDFSQPPAFKDVYGTPTDEISGFLDRNPGYQFLAADPKFPNRRAGIYPAGKGSEWRTDPNNPTAQNDQWPVDLHIGKHSYEGAKLGLAGATAPLTMELSLPEFLFGTGGALLGGAAGQQGAKAAGAGEFGQEVAGDAAGLLSGMMTTGVTRLASSKVRALYDALPDELQTALRNKATGVVSPRLKNVLDFWDTLGDLRDRFFKTGKLVGELDATGENKPFAGEPRPKPQPWYTHDATGENKPFAGGMDEFTPKPTKPRTMADLANPVAPQSAAQVVPTPARPAGSAGTLAESVAKVTAKPKAAPTASKDPLLTKLRTIAAGLEADEQKQPTSDADLMTELNAMLARVRAGEKLPSIKPVN